MAFFGPGFTLNTKPRWRQSWWWRERLPGIVTWVVFAALAVLVVWVVFHFTGDDDSGGARVPSDTSASRTATPTPSGPTRPTEKPPELPDAAREFSDAGIEATLRFKYDALNYGQRSGDYEPLKRVFDTSRCSACALLVERLTEITSQGSYLDGADYVVSDIKVTFIPNSNGGLNGYVVFSAEQLTDKVIIDSDGNRSEEYPRQSKMEMNHELQFVGDRWVIISSDVSK